MRALAGLLVAVVMSAVLPSTAAAVDDARVRELLIRWAPIPDTAQEAAFDDDSEDAFVLFSGGWGAGKTMWLVAKMLKLSAINAPLPGLWCVPDWNHVYDTILPTLLEIDPDTVDPMTGLGLPWFLSEDQCHYNERRHLLTWEGGGPIQFVTAENATSIAGPNMAYCGTDEPGTISLKAWRNTVARVRHPRAVLRQKVAAGTPEGLNYLNDLFGAERADDYHRYEMTTEQNFELLRHNPKYLEQAKANLSEAELAAYLEGRFVPMAGALAYTAFHDERQCRPDMRAADPREPLRLTFDFNVDPMSLIVGQQWPGPHGLEFTVDRAFAIYGGSTTEEACRTFKKEYPRWPSGLVIYGDATGKNRTTVSIKSNYDIIQEELASVGPITLKVPTINPPVTLRLNSVNRLCRDGRGVTRLWLRGKGKAAPTAALVRSLQNSLKKPGTDELWKKTGETVTHLSDALGYWLTAEAPAKKPEVSVATIKARPAAGHGVSQALADIRAEKSARRRAELGIR